MNKQSRLLLVDSDKTIVASITKRLREYGIHVHAVDSGEEAIDSAAKNRPDIVLVDIELPGTNSFELLGKLSAMENISDIPVILIGTINEIKHTLVGQSQKYIVNKIDLPSLSRKIMNLLAMNKRRRQIEELLAEENVRFGLPVTQELTAEEQEVLRSAGATLEEVNLGANDPVLRGKNSYLNLLESSYTASQASKLLGVNASRIRQRLGMKSLYGIKRGAEWLIPKFQFEAGKLIPNIEPVLARLDSNLHPVSVRNWFVSPNADLVLDKAPEGGYSPREWLLRGYPVEIVERLAGNLHLS